MRPSPLSPAGLELLNRRRFLGGMAGGMAAIALGDLINRSNVNASEVLPNQAPHFAPAAKRVIHIFCTGAVSQLDTWDYKPELIKRHGQPMPGVDKLVTFQGENGNLARSPWTFRPRGETGKMVSDLLPNLAETGRRDVLHSLVDFEDEHARPRRDVPQYRFHGGRVPKSRLLG